MTDVDGNYLLEFSGDHRHIVYSCIGYRDVEKIIVPGNNLHLDIELSQDISQLEESVVIGYGSMKKKDLTGAVGSTEG